MNTQHGMAVSTGALSWARKVGGALLLSLALAPLQSTWAQVCPNPLDVFPACGGGGANTSPSFVSGVSSLTVAQGASATDVKGLLHVSDSDAGQTMTWTQSAAPSHGTLSIVGATASSGSADITPGGAITYTPTPGYSGTDSFAVAVDDGNMGFATRTINVTISGRTVTVNALALNAMTVGSQYVSQTVTASGGFGAYTYSVSSGGLPNGLTLDASTGVISGTPIGPGVYYSFTIQARDSSTGTGPFSGTRAFIANVSSAVPVARYILPNFPPAPPLEGIKINNVSTKDVNQGKGPEMVACLKDTLTARFKAAATYEGQNADGSARFSIATAPVQKLSFYPVDASTASGLPALTATETNTMTVTTSCGTFSTVPALFNSKEFAALAQSMGMTVTINEEGVITVKSGDTVYVGRPDYVVTTGTPGSPSLKQGDDGLWRFTDSLGNVQILRPAFLGPQWLKTALSALPPLNMAMESFTVESDGTITLVWVYVGTKDRVRFKLTAAPTLSPLDGVDEMDKAIGFWLGAKGVPAYLVYQVPGLKVNMAQSYTQRAIR